MELLIEKVGNDGEGIAFYNKLPVYVYYSYKGEVVDVTLLKNKRGVYEGKINNIIKKSPHRVEPLCPYYGKVGASNLMHINYLEQLNYKKEFIHFHVNKNFKKGSRIIPVYKTINAEKQFHYRNKIDVPVRYLHGVNKMGLYERGTNKFIPIDSYVLHEKVLDEAVGDVLKIMDELKINAYSSKTKQGVLTSLSLRCNLEKEVQLTFILNKDANLDKLVERLTQTNKNITSIYKTIVKSNDNRNIFANELILLFGHKYLKMTIDNKTFCLMPDSFFQLNTKQAEKLFKIIVKDAKLNKDDVVLDAYAGVGVIGTFLSPFVKKVYAVEINKNSVSANNCSNLINKVKNLKFIKGDVFEVVNKLDEKFDVMVFDPPREGLAEKTLKFILEKLPKKLIYVSCNPETLTKDLKILYKKYKIEFILPFDMFPQTSHTESFTLLTLHN